MTGPAAEPVVLRGHGRLLPAGADGPAELRLDLAEWTLRIGGAARTAAYRDLTTIATRAGTALLALGEGPGAERALLDGFGRDQGALVRELRDRRLRQRLGDALIEPDDEPIELVEYRVAGGSEHGVAQLAYHLWGIVLAPLDEQVAERRVRRAAIGEVRDDAATGSVAFAGVELVGLGPRATLHTDRLRALAASAADDAGRYVNRLLPDAPYGDRQHAASLLVDGRPVTPDELGSAWAAVEAGVLVDPEFAEAYRTLAARGTGRAWVAMAPERPGDEAPRNWFFVELPGDRVALELVSEGAHATYLFRTGGDAAAAVREISDALVDARFLREPMALPDDQLARAEHLRYRLALRALPSLAAARGRFIARLIHADPESWGAALDAALEER